MGHYEHLILMLEATSSNLSFPWLQPRLQSSPFLELSLSLSSIPIHTSRLICRRCWCASPREPTSERLRVQPRAAARRHRKVRRCGGERAPWQSQRVSGTSQWGAGARATIVGERGGTSGVWVPRRRLWASSAEHGKTSGRDSLVRGVACCPSASSLSLGFPPILYEILKPILICCGTWLKFSWNSLDFSNHCWNSLKLHFFFVTLVTLNLGFQFLKPLKLFETWGF